ARPGAPCTPPPAGTSQPADARPTPTARARNAASPPSVPAARRTPPPPPDPVAPVAPWPTAAGSLPATTLSEPTSPDARTTPSSVAPRPALPGGGRCPGQRDGPPRPSHGWRRGPAPAAVRRWLPS